MPKVEFEEFDRFESNVVALDQAKIDVPLGKFSTSLGTEATEGIIKSLTPATFTGLKDVNIVDVQKGNISVNLRKKKLDMVMTH